MNLKQLRKEWDSRMSSIPAALDTRYNNYLSCYYKNVADIKVSTDYYNNQKFFKANTGYYNDSQQYFYGHMKDELMEQFNKLDKRNLKTLVEWCLNNSVVILSKFSNKSGILYFTIVERSLYNTQFRTTYKNFKQEKLTVKY